MNQLFLIFCTILSLLITISGFISLKSPSQLLPLIVFLPITGYFISSLIKLITHPKIKPDVSLQGNKFPILILICILITLSSLGLKSISKQNSDSVPQKETPLIVKLPSPTQVPELKTITLVHPDPTAQINLRETPASNSAILAKLKVGAKYELIESLPNWAKIKIDSSSSGWIFAEYTQ